MKRSRSREGAWIEIPIILAMFLIAYVAPVRERGLKCLPKYLIYAPLLSLP